MFYRNIALIVLFIDFTSQARRAPQQLSPILLWALFYSPNHDTQQQTNHNTGNFLPYS